METFGQLVAIVIGVIFVKNYVLARFLGLCPFIGVSKKTDAALGMGMAVTFVMTLASLVTWIIHRYLLIPDSSNLIYLIVHSFRPEVVPEDFNFVSTPPLYEALGIYLPLITTNCAVLGVAILNSQKFFEAGGEGVPAAWSFIFALIQGFCAGIGFTLAMLLMSGIRERLEILPVPKAFRGVPIAFVCTGCMALAFMGFVALVKS
ncbi:MAG: electron transport complex protein RnfA [Planctomycetota bacterium]|jgi:electron transport complex protein RnfA